jgi:hypothetical protein
MGNPVLNDAAILVFLEHLLGSAGVIRLHRLNVFNALKESIWA